MFKKLFILGRPGCGKSSAARYIAGHIHVIGEWSTVRFNDFGILLMMFRDDPQRKQFQPSQQGGFHVTDDSVLSTALKRIDDAILDRISSPRGDELFLIEFAREDYSEALKQFSTETMQDAYFLFIDSDIEICVQRIDERSTHPITSDDHFVSEHTLRSYYSKQYFPSDDLIKKNSKIICNNGSWQDFTNEIDSLLKEILKKCTLVGAS